MTQEELEVEDVVLPAKRQDESTLEERMSENAYNDILPSRYQMRDADGELIEAQEEVFERVARNIALGDLPHMDGIIEVGPSEYRSEFLDEFPDGETQVEVTEDNVRYLDHEAVMEVLAPEVRRELRETASEFQDLMEHLSFMPNTPTLINAGDELQQLSACFVDSPADDMDDIHDTAREAAKIFQSGGGMGYAFWKLRPYGDKVGSTGGIASGPITFMRTYDQMCKTIAQGGTRRGAQMGVMKISHPDAIEFIHSKNKDVSLAVALGLNDPKDPTNTTFKEALEEARDLIEDGKVPKHLRNAVERHLSNFNISVGVTEDFMDALDAREDFTFTNPRTGEPHIATQETKDLWGRYDLGHHVTVGEPLSVPAEEVWERIIEGAYENGEPGVIFLDRVNEEHSFDVEEHPDHEILATNPCVTGDTYINTSNGLVQAEELYEMGTSQEVVVDGRLSEDTVKEASSVFRTGEKEVFTLSTEEGYELRLTADHRVMTDDGWIEAQDLEPGDNIHIQDTKGTFGRYGTTEEGRVLGWIVGDGTLTDADSEAKLAFCDQDTELAEDFAGYVGDVIRPSRSNNQNNPGVITVDREHQTHEEEIVCSTRLYEMCETVGLTEKKHQVPDQVLSGSKDVARGFLQGLFSADGSVQGNKDDGLSVRLHSSYLDLLKEVQMLLLNFGVYSRIYENRRDAGTEELPDGRGGVKEYETRAQHDLYISKGSLTTFAEDIGFLHSRKQERLETELSRYSRGPYSEQFTATVDSFEYDSVEDVYDLTESDTHSFIGNGIVTHNCGEQPLEEYEACNLGHINLSTLAAEDAPDWREYDGDVDAFLSDAIDWEEFDRRIYEGTHFLDNVVTMSDFPIPEIEEKVTSMRKIGLGIMGYAQLLIQLGIPYGSDLGNDVARRLMQYINHESKAESHHLAQERGAFDEWDKSKYADPTTYPSWFEEHTGENPFDWEDGFPVRNHNTTTIAPTGTTSMIGNTSGGCEPLHNVAFLKNVSQDIQGEDELVEFDDYFLRVLEANEIDVQAVKRQAARQMQDPSLEFKGTDSLDEVPDSIGSLFVTTGQLTGREHASVQCAFQEGVDSAISKTVNFPSTATRGDVREVYEYIYDHGGKGVTVYVDGSRQKSVISTSSNAADEEDPDTEEPQSTQETTQTTEQVADDFLNDEYGVSVEWLDAVMNDEEVPTTGTPRPRERPKVLDSTVYPVSTGYGELNVFVNEDNAGEPFEVFAEIGKSGGFTHSFTEAIGRLTSLALRSGIPVDEVVDQLDGIRSPKTGWHNGGHQIQSIPDAVAYALEQHTEEPESEPEDPTPDTTQTPIQKENQQESEGGALAHGENPECTECGAMALTYSEGCKKCEACGWSECG